MENTDSESSLHAALNAYEKSRLRDVWTLAAIAWIAWIAVAVPGLASDMTSGAFMGVSIAATARALQVQLRRSAEDKFLATLRGLATPGSERSR